MARLQLQKPHSQGQHDLIYSGTNDVVFAGRRWGKTHMGVTRIMLNSMNRPGLYWWVGLGWKSASLKRAWREIKTITVASWKSVGERKPEKYIRESSKEVILPWGGEIWMRTAERPDSLAGEGILGAVLDEFTLMDERVWTEYVEGCLLDKGGWASFIGVPKGNNWGARLWRAASKRKGWAKWHFTTADNPIIDPEKLQNIKDNVPRTLFDQEYMAVVIDGAGLVFKNVYALATAVQVAGPQPGADYIFGLDWGKKNDWTVITVMDVARREVVYVDRFNQIDYPTQLSRVRALNEKFRPRCIVAESNSMGAPLCDQLIVDGLPIRQVYFTNSVKREYIERLAVAFEQEDIRLPNDKDFLSEFEEYEMEISDKGTVSYHAPTGEGHHDDCVMSTALVWSEVCDGIGVTF